MQNLKPKVNSRGWALLILVLMHYPLYAQIPITGKVSDENGVGLSGVTVTQLHNQNATTTDAQGNYVITLPNEGEKTLVYTYVGFESRQESYTGNPVINVVLKDEGVSLNEVVVMGYTSQKRSTITGAASTVAMDDVEKRRVSNVAQSLQGQVAGVQVTQSTGAPGDPITIRVRGEGTIGNNDPLFIVDGMPSRDITFLNPADIESMTVLKDASAAAVYGSRAASGVVVITTKQGKVGTTSLELNYYNGIQSVANLPKMLSADQYIAKLEEAWNNAGYEGINPYTADKGRTDFANTNWLDELFELGHSQNLQLTAAGGSDKLQFLLSGDYYKQDGIVIFNNDKYQRLNFRTNINANLSDRLKVGTNLQLSYAIQDRLSSKGDEPGIIRHALLRPPILSVYKDKNDPTYSEQDPFTDLPFYKNNDVTAGGFDINYERTSNPIALAYFTDDKMDTYKTFGNFYGEYAFLQDKALRLRTNVGVDLNLYHSKTFNQNFGDDDGGGEEQDKGMGRQNRPTSLSEDRGQELNITWNNTLNYIKSFDKHSINALIGTEYIKNTASGLSASRARFDYTSPAFRYIDMGGTEKDIWNGGLGSEWGLFSLFGSATYVYNEKYMLTANFRADASSRFAENNRWGYFPSVSAGWTISQEDFMKNLEWLSYLRLRASTGKLGNQEIDNYAFMTLLKRVGEKYVIDRYGNPDLKWESTRQHNIGLDVGLLSNKIYLSVDYFDKQTSGILLPISLPKFIGDVKPTYVNSGEVRNNGFEASLTYQNSQHAFKYNINANIATLHNRVEKLHPKLPNIPGKVTETVVGQTLNAYYGYVMEGIYQNEAEIAAHLSGTNNPPQKPGDIRFKDLDGNGIINDNDRTFIGSPIPTLSYGLTLSASYKGFDFSVLFQGVNGVDRYNDSKKIIDYDTRPFNHSVRVLDSWHGEGTSNTIPRVSFTDNGSSKVSSIYVEDASYLRLKNIELGYSFGSLIKKKNIGIQDVRVYVSAQNLFTSTNYTGMDPESLDLIDMGTYPQSRAFLFGLNVKF